MTDGRNLDDDEIEQLGRRAREVYDVAMWEADFHKAAADYWSAVHYGLGLPTVVLSAVASTSALADFDKSNVVAAALALIVAVLAALTTFLNPNKTAESHLTASGQFRTLGYSAQSFDRDLSPSLTDARAKTGIHALEDERNRLIRESPSYSDRVARRVRGRTVPEPGQSMPPAPN